MPVEKKHGSYCGVYVITDGTAVKVGISANGRLRLSALQIGNPRRLTEHAFIHASSMSQARRAEIAVHEALAVTKLHGEWFAVTPHAAEAVVRAVLNGGDVAGSSIEIMAQRALRAFKKN